MIISPKDPEAERLDSLKAFFEAWHELSKPKQTAADPATSLAEFLGKFRMLRTAEPEPEHAEVEPRLNPDRLSQFCTAFRPIFDALQRQGEFIDIWSVAGLKRDELRHASVLAWFLNPAESHGFKDKIFRAWMQKLRFSEESRLRDPLLWMGQYRVTTETYPFSDGSNRIDIEIDGDRFYICIEVKIDAVNCPLSRNCKQQGRFATIQYRFLKS
jgi:PD-(D/E)XK nuclease superfamily